MHTNSRNGGKSFAKISLHAFFLHQVAELFVSEADKAAKTAAAAGYTKLEINKVSMQWLQVLAEGWVRKSGFCPGGCFFYVLFVVLCS